MRRSSLVIVMSLLLFLLASRVPTCQDLDKIEVTTTMVTDHLSMLSGAGGNIAGYVFKNVKSDQGEIFLVDTGYPGLEAKVKAAVAALGKHPVRFVCNTHWHFDHVGGNEALAGSGSVLVAHDNVRKRMESGLHLAVLDRDVPAAPPAALPVLSYRTRLTFTAGDETIEVSHLPAAHTDGDSIVHFRTTNVIHTGDIFFNCGYPFIDISAGGTIDGMIEAVERVLQLCDDETRIIPGHGPLGSKGDLETYLDMLRRFRAVIASEAASGKSLETIVAEQPTADLDARWGKVFFTPEQFTEMVFRSLPHPAPPAANSDP